MQSIHAETDSVRDLYYGTNGEINGERRSPMLFFANNRIDTTQKEKLGWTTGTSLNESFDRMQSFTGQSNQSTKEEFFQSSPNWKLDLANSSDVCIFEKNKGKIEPPGDVPDAAFGETHSSTFGSTSIRDRRNNFNGKVDQF